MSGPSRAPRSVQKPDGHGECFIEIGDYGAFGISGSNRPMVEGIDTTGVQGIGFRSTTGRSMW